MDDRGALRFRQDAAPAQTADSSRRPSSSSTAPRDLKEEVFGPVLHVVRWQARTNSTQLLDDIAGNGYGLTLGIHSRIDDDGRAYRRRGSRTAMST